MSKHQSAFTRFKKFWKLLGPGLITGASDDDPSAITTFTQAGARYGLTTLWMALLAFPALAYIQEMCARIGIVTRKGLTGVVKAHYPKWMLYVIIGLCCPAFVLNMGADISLLGEICHMLFPLIPPIYGSILFTAVLFVLIVLLSFNRLVRVMKLVCLSLLVYVMVPFFTPQHIGVILKNTLIPHLHFNKDFLLTVIGITGSIISPYLFFWQTSTEAEATINVEEGMHKHIVKGTFIAMRKDIEAGAFFAVLIMYFVILCAGTVLHQNGVHTIDTVKDAAMALQPFAGNFAYVLFSLGIVSTVFLIIPVLSGSISYILSETFNWKTGFNNSFSDAKEFYLIILVAVCTALAMQALHINAIKVLFFTTIIYGLISPFIIGVILHICNNKIIMGRYKNGNASNIAGIIMLMLMLVSIAALLYTTLFWRA